MKQLLFTVLATTIILAIGSVAAPAPGVHRSAGKIVAPVELRSGAIYTARVGETVRVPVEFVATEKARNIEVQIGAPEGLLAAESRRHHRLDAVAAGADFSVPAIDVTPLGDGRHALIINVFMDTAAGRRFRSFSITVEAGDLARAPSAKRSVIAVDAGGQPVHVLPAKVSN